MIHRQTRWQTVHVWHYLPEYPNSFSQSVLYLLGYPRWLTGTVYQAEQHINSNNDSTSPNTSTARENQLWAWKFSERQQNAYQTLRMKHISERYILLAHLQCTTGGPLNFISHRRRFASSTKWRTDDGSSGTPWSGQPWNCIWHTVRLAGLRWRRTAEKVSVSWQSMQGTLKRTGRKTRSKWARKC